MKKESKVVISLARPYLCKINPDDISQSHLNIISVIDSASFIYIRDIYLVSQRF